MRTRSASRERAERHTRLRAGIGEVEDLPVIDLTDARNALARDRHTYEDAYAHLAFGLGTVPRRHHRDDPFWQQPAALLVVVALLLLLLLASA